MIDVLCSHSEENPVQMSPIDHGLGVFCPRDVPMPYDNTAYAYILVSRRDPNVVYIGSSKNLIKRFEQHNQGTGALQTQEVSLRPWALLAYIAGFDGDVDDARLFENEWIFSKNNYVNDPIIKPSVEGIVDLALDIIPRHRQKHNLRMVMCGTITRLRQISES